MERRRQHRVKLDENEPVRIELTGSNAGWRAPAELIDLSASGASVRVAPNQALQLTVGGSLTVWVADAASGIELPIGARMVHRREETAGRVLGLKFTDLRTVGALLQPLFGKKFNRRAAFRVTPARIEGTVAVRVAGTDMGRKPGVASLVDISIGGMALDVPVSFEADLEGGESVLCGFNLVTSPAALRATGKIVHRTLRDDLVRYGIMFQDTDAAAFRKTHEAIVSYVIKRQRESAEENELYSGGGIPLGALGPVVGRDSAR